MVKEELPAFNIKEAVESNNRLILLTRIAQ